MSLFSSQLTTYEFARTLDSGQSRHGSLEKEEERKKISYASGTWLEYICLSLSTDSEWANEAAF